MDIKTKHKLLPLSVVIIVVIVGGLVYFGGLKNKNTTPVNYAPDYSPLNKKESFGKNLPPDFPAGLILEGKTLDNSEVVHTVTGKKQVTVSYFSDKTLSELVTMYENNFVKNDWTISGKKVTDIYTTFQVEKGSQKVTTTLALTPDKVLVVFSYEQ